MTRTFHCQSDALVLNGHAPRGKQRYRCRACGRQSLQNPAPHAYPEARREEILYAYQERSNLRGLTRTFGVLGIISRTLLTTRFCASYSTLLPGKLSRSLRRGKGTSGTGTPRNAHKGSQPSFTW